MKKRAIVESRSFIKSVDNYFLFKSNNFSDLEHAKEKFLFIYHEIARISTLNVFPCRIVNYGRSNNMQYFEFQKHVILFKLNDTKMEVKYFIASKRIKKTL